MPVYLLMYWAWTGQTWACFNGLSHWFLIIKWKIHISALSSILFMSHAIWKISIELKLLVRSNFSDICSLSCLSLYQWFHNFFCHNTTVVFWPVGQSVAAVRQVHQLTCNDQFINSYPVPAQAETSVTDPIKYLATALAMMKTSMVSSMMRPWTFSRKWEYSLIFSNKMWSAHQQCLILQSIPLSNWHLLVCRYILDHSAIHFIWGRPSYTEAS